MVHLLHRLYGVDAPANHNAGIRTGVVDQLWRYLLLFLRVSVNY